MKKDFNKPAFQLYCSHRLVIEKLSNERVGILFKHIFRYVNDEFTDETEDIIENGDDVLDVVWLSFKASLKDDLRKYKQRVKTNTINGLKGGRPKKT